MEGGKKQTGSSSFATDLFGAKDSSTASASASSSVFSSIFAPPKNYGRDPLLSLGTEKKYDSGSQSWSANSGVSGKSALGGEGQSQGAVSKDTGSYFQEEKPQPFHYSSSIYYGGQDFYSLPNSQPQGSRSPDYAKFNKEGEDDDSGKASRGNWWQGSLYY